MVSACDLPQDGNHDQWFLVCNGSGQPRDLGGGRGRGSGGCRIICCQCAVMGGCMAEKGEQVGATSGLLMVALDWCDRDPQQQAAWTRHVRLSPRCWTEVRQQLVRVGLRCRDKVFGRNHCTVSDAPQTGDPSGESSTHDCVAHHAARPRPVIVSLRRRGSSGDPVLCSMTAARFRWASQTSSTTTLDRRIGIRSCVV